MKISSWILKNGCSYSKETWSSIHMTRYAVLSKTMRKNGEKIGWSSKLEWRWKPNSKKPGSLSESQPKWLKPNLTKKRRKKISTLSWTKSRTHLLEERESNLRRPSKKNYNYRKREKIVIIYFWNPLIRMTLRWFRLLNTNLHYKRLTLRMKRVIHHFTTPYSGIIHNSANICSKTVQIPIWSVTSPPRTLQFTLRLSRTILPLFFWFFSTVQTSTRAI